MTDWNPLHGPRSGATRGVMARGLRQQDFLGGRANRDPRGHEGPSAVVQAPLARCVSP
jgi:hypothetical protein